MHLDCAIWDATQTTLTSCGVQVLRDSPGLLLALMVTLVVILDEGACGGGGVHPDCMVCDASRNTVTSCSLAHRCCGTRWAGCWPSWPPGWPSWMRVLAEARRTSRSRALTRRPDLHAGAQVLRDSLGLLLALMGAWVAILDEVARGEMAEVAVPGALRFDLPRVEGALLACLCSSQPEARLTAPHVGPQ